MSGSRRRLIGQGSSSSQKAADKDGLCRKEDKAGRTKSDR